MKSTEITDINKCTGCSLCESVCPKHSISMEFSGEGFRYPNIDESSCIDCGLCRRRCPVNSPVLNGGFNQTAFLAKNKDDSIYFKSSSGGVFFELARNVIKNCGVVFGAAWDKDFICRHICVDNLEDVYKLLGSKYVQSDTSGIWQLLKEKVASGNKVLFSGTPCQIGAVRSIFTTVPDNLLLVEVICMGVPSPFMFKNYLHDIQTRLGTKIETITFREKKYFGELRSHSLIVEDNRHKKYARTRNTDPFFMQFFQCNILRRSCYECEFKSKRRAADLTLGDCWGMHNIAFSRLGHKVVSLVLINTHSGLSYFTDIQKHFDITEISKQLVFKCQPMLIESCSHGPLRDSIFKTAPTSKEYKMYDYLRNISGFGYKQALKSWLLHLRYGK